MSFRHIDTYRIGRHPATSIPAVSDVPDGHVYPLQMAEKTGNWEHWGARLRAHVKDQQIQWAKIAEGIEQAESTIRSWCNGTREINLRDFFRLCAAANAEPAQILFGRMTITDDQRMRLGNLVVSVLESDPTVAQHYAPMVSEIKRDYRAKRERVSGKREARAIAKKGN